MARHAPLVFFIICTLALASSSAKCPDSNCECIDTALYYNYLDNKCTDKSEMFNFGGCGPYGTRDGEECRCLDGFNPNGAVCEDVDDCDGTDCEVNEECRLRTGTEYCKCKDVFFRGTQRPCDYLNEAINPLWHNCSQRANEWTPGFKCSCFTPFTLDDDKTSCYIKEEYKECDGHTDTGAVCVTEKATGLASYFALPGFQLNHENKSKDIDECLLTSSVCWLDSVCSNLDEGRGYECKCSSNYTDSLFENDTIKECILMTCGKGEGPDCIDYCATIDCPEDYFCRINGTSPECVLTLSTTSDPDHRESQLFHIDISTFSSEELLGLVTESLEVVFGAGNIELKKNTSNQFEGTVMGEGDEDRLTTRLHHYCDNLEQLPGYCELPRGTIVKNDTLNLRTLASGAPQSLELSNSSSNSLTVMWKPPLEINGVLRNYIVTWAAGDAIVGSDTLTHSIDELDADTDYTISVKAVTMVEGEPATKIFRTRLSNEGSNVGAIIGGIVGAVVVIALLSFLGVTYYKKRQLN